MDLSLLTNLPAWVYLAAIVAVYFFWGRIQPFLNNLLKRVGGSSAPQLPDNPPPLPMGFDKATLLAWLKELLLPEVQNIVREEIANRPAVAEGAAVKLEAQPDGSYKLAAPGLPAALQPTVKPAGA